ncbi:MAG: cytidine deaminase [Candidatus Marinimicrobia bacterium]|nr:cytidine deaminase [Candidatus Neomarinimicrobiota bacterium]
MDKQSIQNLCKEAEKASQNAHAPYSNFHVGAALLAKNHKIYHGCNVESSSYGLTICAERNAIAAAVVHGETEFEALAVYSSVGAAPCGACRQVIWDICHNIPVYVIDDKGHIRTYTSAEILPVPFDENKLKEAEK